jgi:endonuclease G
MTYTKAIAIVIGIILGFGNDAMAEQAAPRSVSACQREMAYGLPQSHTNGTVICRSAYATSVDPQAKIPIWVAYQLSAKNATGCGERSNNFAADQSLPKGQRAELVDYYKSGFDKGHLVPSGDMRFNSVAESESYLLSNMSPQYPATNRGDWSVLEATVRAWAHERNHTLVVYAGNVYDRSSKTIGPNQVVVPNALYKIVVDTTTLEAIGYIVPNTPTNGEGSIDKYRAPINDISKMTGVFFPLPPKVTEVGIGREWKADIRDFRKDKKTVCER